MKKIFNIKIFNVLILFLMICSCIFITGCKQKEVTEEEMDEWLLEHFGKTFNPSSFYNPEGLMIAYGIYKKPKITTDTQYACTAIRSNEENDSKKINNICELLSNSDDYDYETLELSFSEMYNKAVKEKMRMVIYKQYHEKSEKDEFEMEVAFISKDGILYGIKGSYSLSSTNEKEYIKEVYKYTLKQGTSVYKEIAKFA